MYQIVITSEGWGATAPLYNVTGPRGRLYLSTYDQAAAEAKLAELEAAAAARAAKRAAYGARLRITTEGLPKALAMRGKRLFQVLDADGTIIATYNTFDEVPDLEPEITAQAMTETEAGVEPSTAGQPAAKHSDPAVVRGTITDAQIERIWSLVRNGAHEEGGFYTGPSTLADIYAMSCAEADIYLRSLTGNY